jgi:hypothetical protein
MGFQSLKLKLIIDFDLIVTFIRLYIATSVQIMPRHRMIEVPPQKRSTAATEVAARLPVLGIKLEGQWLPKIWQAVEEKNTEDGGLSRVLFFSPTIKIQTRNRF